MSRTLALHIIPFHSRTTKTASVSPSYSSLPLRWAHDSGSGGRGIYDTCFDLPQQKLTIISWADPGKLVKAIKKSRKTATICPDPNQPAQPPEPPLEGGQPPPEAAKPSDHPPPKASWPADPPKDLPTPDNPQPPKPEIPQGEANPTSGTKEPVLPPFGQQQDGDVFMISWPNNYGYRQPWFGQPVELTAPFHITHRYNTCMPFPLCY
ncbi:hypothetical protein CRG98_014500 [Punica granatum]|uniref:Uncharacterized protein n=1 Tax=Punica granatum TaxID=22663 RepID=A0A2I0K907_PUNGR|nr:hypothetical protein CRG98_014500 [Punica granatum]